jgi:hypothetical protein
MKKLPLVLSVGSIALLLGGCPSSEPTASSPPTPPVSPLPSSSPQSAVPPTFEGATQPGKTPAAIGVPGLIPATNADRQRAEIARGRVDPFSLFPLQPDITIKIPEDSAQGRKPSGSGPREISIKPIFSTQPTPPSLPPQPTEARGVEVSGIVQLPSTAVAIVKAPGERTERRVVAGSTLSSGRILVKSIDANPENPSIVLEQYGQTVIKKLGAGTQAATPNLPTAIPQSAMIYPESAEGAR